MVEDVIETGSRVLLVDDDPQTRLLVARFLRAQGFRVTAVAEGAAMRAALAAATVDLVILDVMLPGTSGLELCRELRERSDVPIVMLTARGEEADRIAGLELGADDYLPKPFNPLELLARVNAVLRRAAGPRVGARRRRYRFAGWTLDAARRELSDPTGVAIDLSTGEFDMLLAFVESPRKVLSRDHLLDSAKNRVPTGFDRVIDVQISRLRKKIEAEPGAEAMIKTVRGIGYMFLPSVERA